LLLRIPHYLQVTSGHHHCQLDHDLEFTAHRARFPRGGLQLSGLCVAGTRGESGRGILSTAASGAACAL